jgi:hypothetical protein
MAQDAQEHIALVQRILATPAFTKAPLRKALLAYLFEHRETSESGQKTLRFIPGKEIAHKVFKISDKEFLYDAARVPKLPRFARGAGRLQPE